MAKLSDLFGRKLSTAGPDNFTGRSRNGNGNGSDHISIESLSDVGSRIGEENQVLRNLLTDTGRRSTNSKISKTPLTSLLRPSTAPCARSSRKNRRT
jgi:crescentin